MRVVGLPVGLAGTLLFCGTLVGLGAPWVVGAVVDRSGPRRVVITPQLIQAAGTVLHLLAGVTGSAGRGRARAVGLAVGGAWQPVWLLPPRWCWRCPRGSSACG
ncbi:hypothetical protein [Kineococcus aurantiacus]|uniref:MFS family permease n=1 Tax=Kineococcus aurantiacus TaxID=37633 RepID=A0A7Y9DQK7_9ACTN|nr:MFS family permease [Kineococcus aurantiacus]